MSRERVGDADDRSTAWYPVLVVVVNNQRDWQHVVADHWYRIPAKHAPVPLAAHYLAFYCTKALADAAHQITYYAPIERIYLRPRVHLLPDEPDHPRAAELYYQVVIGPLHALDQPLPSRRLRRITFIPTSLEQLRTATDVAELWMADESGAIVWRDFRHAAMKAIRRLTLEEARAAYGACTGFGA